MNYGSFRLIISYQLDHKAHITNLLHMRDLQTLDSVCASEDIEQEININEIFKRFKKVTGLQVSNETLYNYFRSLGVRFVGVDC